MRLARKLDLVLLVLLDRRIEWWRFDEDFSELVLCHVAPKCPPKL